MNLMKKLQEKDSFSPTEQLIVRYMLENKREVPMLSARELAERTYTSSAAVVRLCQRLGLEGYREFKIQFAAEAAQEETLGLEQQLSITKKDTILSIIDKVTSIDMDALRETRNGLDPADITRAVFLIDHAEHIDIYAIDNNLHIADMLSYQLSHAGKSSTVNHKHCAQYMQAINSKENHLSILISRTGENRRLIEIADILRRQNSKILLLTSEKDSPLANIATQTLCAAAQYKFNELGTFVFLASAKYIVDILYSVIMSRHYEASVARNKVMAKEFSRSN